MKNMRYGFTMIELIFVIVIIGILAAVAIPKLAATRDDAKISAKVADARTCLSDVASSYTATGSWPAWPQSCSNSNDCFNYLQDTPVAGSLTVSVNGAGTTVCDGAHTRLGSLPGVYIVGGTSISL